MKKHSLIDYGLYLLAKAFSLFLCALPVNAALGIGRAFGSLGYIFNFKRSKVAYANMRAAFCEEKSPAEIRAIVKRLYKN